MHFFFLCLYFNIQSDLLCINYSNSILGKEYDLQSFRLYASVLFQVLAELSE